jgi:hypothetical protein
VKWVIIVYMAMFTQGPEVMKYTVLEFPAPYFAECQRIAAEINQIETAHKSKTPYVRSFYWVYNNMLDDIKAECVFANPPAPKPKWADIKKEWGVPDIIE